jgi:LysM repeat protein
MTHKAMILLMSCAVLLAGCYRQADDSFQQVDSQSVQSIASPTTVSVIQVPAETTEDVLAPNTTDIAPTTDGNVLPSKTPDPADLDPTIQPLVSPTLSAPSSTIIPAIVPTATSPVFVTPEPPPGQVEQPTILPPTATATFDIVPPTATNIADGPQAGDDCIYEIVAGDNLFRIAIENGTTVEALQQANSIEGDTINVGDLLTIPGCVPGQSSNEPDSPVAPTATSLVGGSSVATVEPVDGGNIPTAGQQIHVVVSGETLGGIANRYGTSIAAIVELNNMQNPDALAVGDELVIPARN